jgi:diguanylate cyclase (GGDEF)-like protein/PAS domain S-box-containing protein
MFIMNDMPPDPMMTNEGSSRATQINESDVPSVDAGKPGNASSNDDSVLDYAALLLASQSLAAETAQERLGAQVVELVKKLSEASHRLSVELAERKHAEEALRESEEKLRTVINASPDGIATASLEGTLQWVSPRILKMWGYDAPDEMVGHSMLEFIDPADREKALTHVGQMLNGTFTSRAEYRMVRKDGSSFFSEANAEFLRDTLGNVIGMLFTQRDVSERVGVENMLIEARRTAEAANRELKDALAREEHLARIDWLTGILNRSHFFSLADHEFMNAVRFERPIALLMFDIDHFKLVNDQYGHPVGDMVLHRIAQTAARQIRAADVIGRYGGEEFIVLLPMTNSQQALIIANRILSEIGSLRVETDRGVVAATISLGLAERTPDDNSVEQVIDRADQAMYAAKRGGRNRVVSA